MVISRIFAVFFLVGVFEVASRLFAYFQPPTFNFSSIGVLVLTYMMYAIGAICTFKQLWRK